MVFVYHIETYFMLEKVKLQLIMHSTCYLIMNTYFLLDQWYNVINNKSNYLKVKHKLFI